MTPTLKSADDESSPSSLEILDPEPSFTPKSHLKTPTEAHLEELGTRFVEMCNTRDWDNPFWGNHMIDGFTTRTHAVQHTSSREEYIERFKVFTKMNPDNRWDIINMSAEVDEEAGRATVWMMLKAGGQPNSIQGERVNATYFRRTKKGVWMAYSGTQIPGISVDF